MANIFLDTCEGVTLGLLNADHEWLHYSNDPKAKSSGNIHEMIHSMLSDHGLELENIDHVIHVSGPGSYTGVRISEGLTQILKWQKMKIASFYHYEVPSLCGFNSGKWFSNAFKGEFFIYSWNGEKTETQLLGQAEFEKELAESTDLYCIQPEGFRFEIPSKVQFTRDLIKEHSTAVFKKVLANPVEKEVFYYRTLEKEFSKKA